MTSITKIQCGNCERSFITPWAHSVHVCNPSFLDKVKEWYRLRKITTADKMMMIAARKDGELLIKLQKLREAAENPIVPDRTRGDKFISRIEDEVNSSK